MKHTTETRTDMDNIVAVMAYLKKQGYDNEFTVNNNSQVLIKGKLYPADDVKLLRTFRFEGESDPAEESIIYLIQASDGVVGYSLDVYGMYSTHMDDGYAFFVKQLSR